MIFPIIYIKPPVGHLIASRSGQLPLETFNCAEVSVGISRPAGPGTLLLAKSERGLWPQGVTGGGATFINRPWVATVFLWQGYPAAEQTSEFYQ